MVRTDERFPRIWVFIQTSRFQPNSVGRHLKCKDIPFGCARQSCSHQPLGMARILVYPDPLPLVACVKWTIKDVGGSYGKVCTALCSRRPRAAFVPSWRGTRRPVRRGGARPDFARRSGTRCLGAPRRRLHQAETGEHLARGIEAIAAV